MRLATNFAPVEDYQARLEFELNVINQMGFAGYFLIVMEFIAWAKDNDIPVGPEVIRRWVLGGIRPRHHRFRPAGIRLAV